MIDRIVSIESKRDAAFSYVAPIHHPKKPRKRVRKIDPKKVKRVKDRIGTRRSPAKMDTREMGKTGMARERNYSKLEVNVVGG